MFPQSFLFLCAWFCLSSRLRCRPPSSRLFSLVFFWVRHGEGGCRFGEMCHTTFSSRQTVLLNHTLIITLVMIQKGDPAHVSCPAGIIRNEQLIKKMRKVVQQKVLRSSKVISQLTSWHNSGCVYVCMFLYMLHNEYQNPFY